MAGKKVLKASPKIYIADSALRNAVLMDDSILPDPAEMGKVVETSVYNMSQHSIIKRLHLLVISVVDVKIRK